MAEAEQNRGTGREGWRGSQRREAFGSQLDVTKLWWAGFGAGSALIILSAWVPVPYFYFVGLVLPLAVLGLYAYVGLRHTASSDGHAQFADTVYYLGFIFTLVTLALALIYLATQEWDKVPLAELVGRFGLALATTIVGLAIRVAAVNLVQSKDGVREDVEQALVDSMEKFRIQLEVATDSFEGYSNTYLEQINQTAAAAATVVQDQTELAGRQLRTSVENQTQAIEKATRAYTAAVESGIKNMKMPDEIIASSLKRPLEAVSEVLRKLHVAVSKIVESQNDLAERSAGATEKFAAIENNLLPLAEFSDSLEEIGSELRRSVAVIQSSFDVFAGKVGDTSRGLVDLSKEAGAVRAGLDQLSKQLEASGKATEALTDIAGVAKGHSKELEVNLAKSRHAVSALQDELVNAARTITSKLS